MVVRLHLYVSEGVVVQSISDYVQYDKPGHGSCFQICSTERHILFDMYGIYLHL